MKKLLFSLLAIILVLFISQSCTKQENITTDNVNPPSYNLGCELLTPAEYQTMPVAELPPMLKTTLTYWMIPNLPAVGNQGGEGSCVAFGTAYAARSIDWAIHNGQTSYSYSTNIFSPEYVYNQIKVPGNCGSGAYVYKGLNLLQSQGDCRWSVMPYTDVACKTKPNNTQKAAASNFKISSYGTVAINVSTIKDLLASNKPVIVAGPVDNNFVNLANNVVLTNRVSSLGGHCYCLVGFDDSKNAFKFINSWGTGWASSGYGYINYSNITQWWQEAYVITTL